MLKMKQLEINCIQLKEGNFFLYAFENGEPGVPLPAWTFPLFQWHESSFYGSKLNATTVHFQIGNRTIAIDGVLLDSFETLELFGTEPFNQFIQWEFDELANSLLAISPVIYETIVEKRFKPDFESWKNGEFRWEVPDQVWYEFLPEFWETQVTELFVDHDEDVGGEPVRMKEFVQHLFHNGVESYLSRVPKLGKQWRERKDLLQNAIADGLDASLFFDEKKFLQWIGASETDLPFKIGLHLEEPHEDGEMWQLTTVLRDVKKPETVVVFNPTKRGKKRLPKKWELHLDEVVAEQKRIARLIPWLANEYYKDSEQEKMNNANLSAPPIVKEELTEDEAWAFLTNASEKLLLLGIDILLPSWWEALKNANMRLKARVKSSSGGPSFVGLNALLDYEWRVSMAGVDLSEAEFRKLVEENRRLINVGGQWMKLDPAFIKKMQSIMEKAEKEGMRVQDFIEQQLLYGGDNEEPDSLDEDNDQRIFSRIQIELHPKLRNFVHSLTDLTDIPNLEVPTSFQGELRPYQKKGMNWLYFLRQYGFGACLADDMGLGKTIQLIAYLLLVKENNPASGPSLIICPTSVLGNWQKELERFSPDLHVYLHYGASRLKAEQFIETLTGEHSYDVVLTTYGLSHLDFEELSSLKWEAIILDEAQNIKNAATKQSRAIRKLKGYHHIALTGTPMENRLTELWSIFDFINKGYLGSLTRFQQRFVLPIERQDNKEKIQELQKLIRPFLLRRTKNDEEVALNLPDKIEQKEYCPLTVEQASLYEQIVKDTFDRLATLSGFERKGYVLKLLSMLKQLCNHPALFLKEHQARGEELIERSTKLEKLVELFDTVMDQNESGLIFTQYIGMGEMIQSVLEARYGLKVPFLNGSTSKQQRDTLINNFQKGEFPILLLSLKAGGTGLNLTAANHVIHYDRWWNPAVENQATDRAYRIGQTKFVHVHKFITTGTLEEKIDAMLEKKQTLNDQIIQSDQWLADMSDEDLYDILKLE
ncbi:DEAD/DEAH box helicase [Caldibacillus sp. 210928-DFI.2.22]|uniref:DEAD/DEAH box helicase n=1 Tax=unclassified Caldibacillus TaxID=2641266 RepID=UPI001D07C810|nr:MULTISPECIES: DEAD/DEAH box helicase [unclassified Caldibacillus]MCB7070789.1 DEAD/DEAH box helicase [Caldibacillus sp. 210928-DFI.2.22]MCB7074290.1 DEAD/DEAH box helicase [Caldibacillus sp. 210928-DFI.2.18]